MKAMITVSVEQVQSQWEVKMTCEGTARTESSSFATEEEAMEQLGVALGQATDRMMRSIISGMDAVLQVRE